MKNIFSIVAAILLIHFSFAQNTLSKKERKFAANYMKETRDSLLKEIKGLSEAQMNFKPAPDKWNIATILDHIALSESELIDTLKARLALPANPAKRSEIKVSDTTISRVVTDRSDKSKSPPFLQPKGQTKNPEESVNAFLAQRKKNIEFIMTSQDDFRNHFGGHRLMGTIDAYQSYLLISAHSMRHVLQIEEVKSDPNFPNK
ncbi:MAG: DinB family protein [Chitinophagales bacterium]